jgi:hypothetical protein
MKKIAFAFGLVAATALAAPLSAQQRNDGPWWDPANTGTRTDTRDGRIYDGRDGRVYDGRIYDRNRVDGRWHAQGRDRSGNVIYTRMRYDNRGNVIREVARRDRLGRYRVIDRRVVQQANRRNDRWDYNDRRDRNDRWDRNNGHDNGKHKGHHKDKGKNKGRGRR